MKEIHHEWLLLISSQRFHVFITLDRFSAYFVIQRYRFPLVFQKCASYVRFSVFGIVMLLLLNGHEGKIF